MPVIEGTAGSVKIGAVEVGKLTSITITIEQDTTDSGPYIGEPEISTIRTGLSATIAGEGVMEEPTNAGQQDILDAILAGTDANLIIEIGDPAEQTFTCATSILTSVEVGLDTGEGAPLSFEAVTSGAFTLVAAV